MMPVSEIAVPLHRQKDKTAIRIAELERLTTLLTMCWSDERKGLAEAPTQKLNLKDYEKIMYDFDVDGDSHRISIRTG